MRIQKVVDKGGLTSVTLSFFGSAEEATRFRHAHTGGSISHKATVAVEAVDVPTDKKGLIAFLNGMLTKA